MSIIFVFNTEIPKIIQYLDHSEEELSKDCTFELLCNLYVMLCHRSTLGPVCIFLYILGVRGTFVGLQFISTKYCID